MEPHNSLKKLRQLGQSIWIDYTRRDLIASGELRRMIDEDAVTGMTSNPSIFENAIAGSEIYDGDISEMGFKGRAPIAIYEALSRTDIQRAADEFRTVYDKNNGNDGFVSLEVNPHLAHETDGTIVEARRLWRALGRPNAFIKVPATAAGIPAIKQLTIDGINVNITLVFGLTRYEQVIDAYIAGLRERLEHGKKIEKPVSVASFFLSRIDTMVDLLLDRFINENSPCSTIARKLRGSTAIASATAAHDLQKKVFGGPDFQKLIAQGARPQKLLWASTSAKDPSFDELKYVESFVASGTITTLTPKTLAAYKTRGNPAEAFGAERKAYEAFNESLRELGIDLDEVARKLEAEGVAKFTAAFDRLIAAIKHKTNRTRCHS